jgi:hypothetical protein
VQTWNLFGPLLTSGRWMNEAEVGHFYQHWGELLSIKSFINCLILSLKNGSRMTAA